MRACPHVRKPPSCVGTRRSWYAGVSPAVFPASRGRDARVPGTVQRQMLFPNVCLDECQAVVRLTCRRNGRRL